MAERMGVKQPPIQIGTKEEKVIFCDFIKENPRPTIKEFSELAKTYLEKSDCVKVFPKLPSMIKAHYSEWKKKRGMVLLNRQVGEELNNFLRELARPVGASETRGSTVALAGDATANTIDAGATNEVAGVNSQGNDGALVGEGIQGNRDDIILTAKIGESQSVKGQSCYWSPFCPNKATECGGRKSNTKCSYMATHYAGKMPTAEELKLKKTEKRNEKKREEQRRKRYINE